LREGKIFLFSLKNMPLGSKLPQRQEHFWLCGICAKEWTLAMDAKEGVKLVETRRKRSSANSAIAPATAS
jgi:hypothetical protein